MKTYIVKTTLTGKEFKEFVTGVDNLDDNKLYRMEWKLEGFWNFIRGWWAMRRRHPGEVFDRS